MCTLLLFYCYSTALQNGREHAKHCILSIIICGPPPHRHIVYRSAILSSSRKDRWKYCQMKDSLCCDGSSHTGTSHLSQRKIPVFVFKLLIRTRHLCRGHSQVLSQCMSHGYIHCCGKCTDSIMLVSSFDVTCALK